MALQRLFARLGTTLMSERARAPGEDDLGTSKNEARTEGSSVDPGPLDERLREFGYFASAELALGLRLAVALGRPLLLEGPAGVGKTELAKVAARVLGRRFLRLQCYEGIDESRALYEWDYGKQILATQLDQTRNRASKLDLESFFSERFLLKRPVLAALESSEPSVLLIDEIDRADPELEALLLEVLAENALTIPELGTIHARFSPLFVLTSNATRELSEALRRRCLHASVDYPEPSRELAIVLAQLPALPVLLAQQVVSVVSRLRAMEMKKAPSVAESLDWARALLVLSASSLTRPLAEATLGVVLKHGEDRQIALEQLDRLLSPG